MKRPNIKFQEEYSAKLPALSLLLNLGWSYLSPTAALAARGGKTDEVVLRDLLRAFLERRAFTFAGKRHSLSARAVDHLLAEVCRPALNEGLVAANERMYNHLLYGISVPEFVDGKKANPTIALIDWDDPADNSFVFTEEFSVTQAGGAGSRRPDIVCFVNGIPLVVIEAKRPDGHAGKGPTIKEGISQNLRNQRLDEIPLLFVYSQLLLSINGIDGRYGTCGTPETFWALWREEGIPETEMHAIKNRRLSDDQVAALFDARPAAAREWYEDRIAGGELALTGQDRLLIGLLRPLRLLEMTRLFILFDKRAGKVVARYQQVFAILRLIERINRKGISGGREGGVIWHTTGSGKSFMMVLLSKALILHDSLKQCRIIVVTDRVSLESQLSRTFASSGELADKKDRAGAMATSGTRLASQIGTGRERIIFSLIQKFNTATRLPNCANNSPDIIVLIDEGHRSQGGENNTRMRQALPNAAFVAFTGTPLLKNDKTTSKFGPILHAYTMQRAVDDGAVTPLLYEERIPDLEVNERALDRWFERITEGLSDNKRGDLKRRFTRKGQVYRADDRIHLIALDIADHFCKNIIDMGLKGQLACESREMAIKYKKYLDEAGLFESAVVMSPPDTREGNTAVDESAIPELTRWWKKHVGTEDEQIYTRRMIERFGAEDDPLKMLIVVDKLLTGFDESKNAVLYIDKSLHEHNLIQAIARVNRLHPKKKFGLLIDYRGILAELDTTIQKYQDLAARTQSGYDIDDITGLYHPMSTEYKRLPQLYRQLWDIFDEVKNKNDIEQLRQVLVPRIEEQGDERVDVHLPVREAFYEALTAFSSCLKVALQSITFFEDRSFSEDDRRHYKETIKQFLSLRRLAQQDAGEHVGDEYDEEMKRLLDRHLVGVDIKESGGVYEVSQMGQPPEEWSEEKTRNETDIIKTRITRMIEQDLQDDPYAQETFSKLLRQAIKEAEELFDHPLKQYVLFQELEQQVEKRRLDEIPDVFSGNHQAQGYFGVFKIVLPEMFATTDPQVQKKWVELSFAVDKIVRELVAQHSINRENLEADIRKELLPRMYAECQKIGQGMQQAKKIVEMIVQATRVGRNGVDAA